MNRTKKETWVGKIIRLYEFNCLYCEQNDYFGFGKTQKDAESIARKHGWMKTREGWAHKHCNREYLNVQKYA